LEEVYLIRHGSVENPQGVVYGRREGFPLSQRGSAEARQTSDFLKDRDIQVLFHSPLQRCVETASILQRVLNVPLVESPDINEWGENETLRDVQARMNTFWMMLYAQPYERIGIVSHRDPLRTLMLGLAGKKLSEVFRQEVFPFMPASVWLLKSHPDGTTFEDIFIPGTQRQ